MKLLAKDLRDSIFQAAIQGKLVEQRPEDGTAEELYQQIQKEKQRLIAEKKIKKEKPLPEITEDEKPFDIPNSWKWCRVNQICYLNSGGQYTESETGIPYIKVADMNLPENAVEIKTSSRFVECSDSDLIYPNSIIFPKRGGAIATNKKRKVIDMPICIDSNTMAMSSITSEIFDYIYFWFANVDLGKLSTGTSVPQINNKDIEPLLIPLPPIAEQKRIVEKIEQILPHIDQYEKMEKDLEKLEKEFPEDMKNSLLQAAMQGKLTEQLESDGSVDDLIEQIKVERQKLEAEGKIKKSRKTKKSQQNDNFVKLPKEKYPYNVPNNWSWTTLNEITISNKGQGLTKNDIGTGEIPAILYGQLYTTYSKRITNVISSVSEKCVHKSLQVYKDNIILPLTSTSPKSEIGKGIIYYSDKEAYLGSDILCLKHFINSAFLALLINSPKFNQLKMEYVKGITIKHLNIDGFLSIPIAIPPIEEQQRIVEILDKLLPLCEML